MGVERGPVAQGIIDGIVTDDFTAFYREQYPNAVRLAWLLLHDEHAGEDIVQDSFLRLRPRFHDVDNHSSYLRQSVINGCRDRIRSSQRSRRRLRLFNATEPLSTLDQPSELIDSVSRLPYKQRAVIVLRYWADLPEAEIAAAVGVRPNTVRTLAARGLASLRKELPDGH